MWRRYKYWIISFSFVIAMLCFGAYIATVTVYINQNLQFSEQIKKIQLFADLYIIEVGKWTETVYTDESFMVSGTSPALENALHSLDSSRNHIIKFKEVWLEKHPEYLDEITRMIALIDSSGLLIMQMAYYFKQKGFKNYGIEGEMRESIHKIENHPVKPNLVPLLTLRRHEKDFLLRKDIGYIKKFEDTFQKYKVEIEESSYSEEDKKDIIKNLLDYKDHFQKLAKVEETIGFYSNSGIRGKINEIHREYLLFLDQINGQVKEKMITLGKHSNSMIYMLVTMFCILLLALFIGYYYYMKYISKPISDLEIVANKIAEGKMSVNIEIENASAVLKEVFVSFMQVTLKIKETIDLIEKITSRKQKNILNLKSNEDEIGLALNKIILQLKEIDEQDEIRKWEAESTAKFLNLMRTHETISLLCNHLLTELCKHIGANLGAIYIAKYKDSEGERLEMVACYAYDRKKHISNTIYPGEGVAGQAYLEKETIFLTDIPKDFMRIKSGTGECIPRSSLIVPIQYNSKINGILELASIKIFQPHEIQFVEKLAEALASTIQSLQIRQSEYNNTMVSVGFTPSSEDSFK